MSQPAIAALGFPCLPVVSGVCPGRRRGAIELFISGRFLNSPAPELDNAASVYGMYSRIARELGVTPQHVRGVARGLTYSRRVSEAVERELVRLRAERDGGRP